MSSKSRVYAVLVTIQFFFATLPIAAKVALRDLSSPALSLLRVVGAAALFLVLHRALVREPVRSPGDYARLALYALFGVVANQLLYVQALTLTTATAAQTMQTTGPAMTLLIAILLGRERATPWKWVGIATAAAGMLYLVGVDLATGSGMGNLLAFLNVAAFSAYLVLSRDLARRYHPLTVITWVFVFGVAGMVPWGVPALLAERGGVTPATWAALAWIVVVPTVMGYYLNVWALQRVQSSVVAVYVYLQPIATAMLAVPILGERPSARLIPAGALIFAGVAVTLWAERRARPGAPPSPAEQEHVEV